MPAVVIAVEVWNAICNIGDSALGGGGRGVGLPISTTGGNARYIGPEVNHVPTTGGSWGSGAMICRDGTWTWVADVTYDENNGNLADSHIDSQRRLDLRLRLVAKMPCIHGELRTTAAGRRRLRAALTKPETLAIIEAVAADRIALPVDVAWQERHDTYSRNDSFGVSYECTIAAADGCPAIYASALYLMPTVQVSGSRLGIIDVRMDFDGFQTEPCRPNTPVGRPVTLAEIVEFCPRPGPSHSTCCRSPSIASVEVRAVGRGRICTSSTSDRNNTATHEALTCTT